MRAAFPPRCERRERRERQPLPVTGKRRLHGIPNACVKGYDLVSALCNAQQTESRNPIPRKLEGLGSVRQLTLYAAAVPCTATGGLDVEAV